MADVTARDATEGTPEDQGLAEGTTKSIWHSIFLEVDKVSSHVPVDLPILLLETANCQGLYSSVSVCAVFFLVATHNPRQASLQPCSALPLPAHSPLTKAALMHVASQSWHRFSLSKVYLIMPVVLQSADLTIGKLTNSLRMPHAAPRQAADAIKHLLHLQAEGARSTRSLNPIKLYLEAQVSVNSPHMHCRYQSSSTSLAWLSRRYSRSVYQMQLQQQKPTPWQSRHFAPCAQ